MAGDYAAFLAGKAPRVQVAGIEVAADAINPALFGFQRATVAWAVRRGRAALFYDCGLGKGPMALEWARIMAQHTDRPALILAPLAVSQQFAREGQKFGVPVTICRTQADVRPGVNVSNYEMLDHFMPEAFGAVVLDESGILKNYMGSLKRRLTEAFARTPYRLCCTATPAPNDHMELGNHAEFLGIMPANEMLSRWFINDTMKMGTYRLKGHAERDFWDWVSSWAVSARRPSDIGYSDEGYVLPPLSVEQVSVPVDLTEQAGDMLFRHPSMNATTMHREMRLTARARAEAAAALVNASAEAWIVWCHTDYEADELAALIPDAVEVRGSESLAAKERKLEAFTLGQARVVISKPSLAGWGLNWQHCHNVVFAGMSWSFEALYQAIRRSYRFGQQHPVQVYIMVAETEGRLMDAVQRKMADHERMLDALTASARRLTAGEDLQLARYQPTTPMVLPSWLTAQAA